MSADLTTGWDFLLLEHQENLVKEIHRRRPTIVYLEPPVHLVLGVDEHELEEDATACAGAWDEHGDGTLGIQPPQHAYPAVGRPGVCAGSPLGGNLVDAPMGSALPR